MHDSTSVIIRAYGQNKKLHPLLTYKSKNHPNKQHKITL